MCIFISFRGFDVRARVCMLTILSFLAQDEMVTKLAGRWEPAVEDDSPWMTGMTISPDGTFRTKWDGNRHLVTDGRVTVDRGSDGVLSINLKRACEGQIF